MASPEGRPPLPPPELSPGLQPGAAALPPGPWPWPPLLRASVGLHAAAAASAWLWPEQAGWALASVALNHAGISAAGLWPRSRLLGPNITRLPRLPAAPDGQVIGATNVGTNDGMNDGTKGGSNSSIYALTIDDGPDPATTPAVLDLLAAHGVKASFFCIAARAQAHPALLRRIVAEGHCVQNHTLHHRHDFSISGPAALRREIAAAQTILADLSGQAPHCFRAPAGLRNPFLDPVLHQLGLYLVSWTRRGYDTREPSAARVLARLTRGLASGDILLLHDGHACRSASGQPVILEVLPALFAATEAAGLVAVTLRAALPPRGA